ncbi:hypothetical protein [Streptomyces botrytidirepellens]|uniref:hypothetical protein n=1 Tax=Streptomyces botrytidirepellens TaxID=2486417 RepID=UPI001FE5B150|nr:hypothetical protein [Streptomyces botrytidirepellens]
MAHSAEHLVVARHDYSDTTLDALATPGLVLRYQDLMPTVTPDPEPGPGVMERREAATRGPYLLDPARRRPSSPLSEERKERFIQQLNQASEQDDLEFEELMDLALSGDPDGVRRRIQQMQDQQRQRAADNPGPDSDRPAGHGQEQAAVHQQHRPQGPGRM